MFSVQGYIDGVSYTIQVGGEPIGMRTGIASGSTSAIALLDEWNGQDVELSPVGPVVRGDVGSEEGVLAILTAHSVITSVEGEAPEVLTADAGVVH